MGYCRPQCTAPCYGMIFFRRPCFGSPKKGRERRGEGRDVVYVVAAVLLELGIFAKTMSCPHALDQDPSD